MNRFRYRCKVKNMQFLGGFDSYCGKKIISQTYRNIIFQVRTEKESLYQILQIKPSSNQDEIK